MIKNLLLLILFLPNFLSAQLGYPGSFNEYYLNANNIKAAFYPRGNKFADGVDGGFLVPYPSKKRLSTIFASSVWIGGFDGVGNLKHGVEEYPVYSRLDFSVGPLTSIGVPYPDSISMHFDTVWNVFAEDVLRHLEDYQTDFIVDDTIPNIFGWPGRGNKFFKQFNGFELPNSEYPHWAPFRDMNSNGLYDPDLGDHPILNPQNTGDFLPDHMMWMVFNDVDPGDTIGGNSRPLRFEFQLTSYAFNCQDNEILNNTIFNKYKIISKALHPVDSVFFGMWTDFDLGCSEDDFVGSDSLRSTVFIYNADDIDGNTDNNCTSGADTYDGVPPVQSLTFIHPQMHAFSGLEHSASNPMKEYNILNGLWGDGTPIRPAGNGHNQDDQIAPTRYYFNGDPRDPSAWAAINILDDPTDFKYTPSVSLGRMDPGSIREIYLAYTYHHHPDSSHLGQITVMQENIDSLLRMDLSLNSPCTSTPLCLDNDCVWPGDIDNNGFVDQRDFVMWGAFKDITGAQRNGLISWRGHYGEEWSESLEGINARHSDANGDGIIDSLDIDVIKENFNSVNQFYEGHEYPPAGSDIVLNASPYIHETGRIFQFSISAGKDLENILGLGFEIEFDTSTYIQGNNWVYWPEDSLRSFQVSGTNHTGYPYASIVNTNHEGVVVDSGFFLLGTFGVAFRLKPGVPIPDCTTIRLRNLKAIDSEGNDLHLGSMPLVVCKEGVVSIEDPPVSKTKVFPNPTNGTLYIQSEVPTGIRLYSIDGQLLRHQEVSADNDFMDISTFPPGLYILRIMATGESVKVVRH